jgi:N-acetylmuramoyl-L-alanine amidase
MIRRVGMASGTLPGRSLLGQGAWICLWTFLMAGCATEQQEKAARVANWEQEDKQTSAPTPGVPVVPVPGPVTPPSPPLLVTPAPANQPAETWVPLARWCKSNGLSAPCPVAATPTPGYMLSTGYGIFAFRVGSLIAHWEGLELRLAFAPQMQDGQPYLHTLDLKKTVQPLVLGTPMSFLRTNLTIVVDPGHGWADSGTKSVLGYQYEK